MALSEQMNLLRIDYDKSLVPAGGAEVVGECASPLPGEGRMTAEPAGRKFHEKAMRVRGLITGTCRTPVPARVAIARGREPPFRRRHFTPLSARREVSVSIDRADETSPRR